MKANHTELVFILDRSGSMAGLESDVIGGYNAMLAKQKQEPGTATVTTVLFDNQCELLHDRIDLAGIAPNRAVNYHADGRGTRLNFETVSRTVSHVRKGKPIADDWKREIEEDFKSR